MKTEQKIREILAYIKGYKTALIDYGQTSNAEEMLELKTRINTFEWVLDNCEVNNDNK